METCNEEIASFLEMGWTDIFECRISKIKEDAHPESQVLLTIKITDYKRSLGVRKSTKLVEKVTWFLAIFMVVVSVICSYLAY